MYRSYFFKQNNVEKTRSPHQQSDRSPHSAATATSLSTRGLLAVCTMSLPPAPPSVPVELEDEEGRRQLAYFIWGNRPKQPPPPPMLPPLPPGVNRYAWMVNSFWREFSLFYRQYVSKEIDETGKMTRKRTIEGLKAWDETMEKFAEVIFNFADQVCVWGGELRRRRG